VIGIAPIESCMPIESCVAIKSCMATESCMPIHLELRIHDCVRRGVEWHDTCVVSGGACRFAISPRLFCSCNCKPARDESGFVGTRCCW